MLISILGCGWLGLPMAIRLVNEGYMVKGSTTSENKTEILKKEGIKPYLLNIEPDMGNISILDFFNCDTLIFNIPPKRSFKNVEESFLKIVEFVKREVDRHKISNVVFVSSTSVYPSKNRVVNEKDANPEKASGKALLIAEKLFLEEKQLNTTVIRFGGLIGYDRSAMSLLKKKKEINNASSPLNLIHRDDCVEIIFKVIRENKWGYIFNACADEHPVRKDFYLSACKKNSLNPPLFKDSENKYKIVSNDFLKTTLNYIFKYPNPLEID